LGLYDPASDGPPSTPLSRLQDSCEMAGAQLDGLGKRHTRLGRCSTRYIYWLYGLRHPEMGLRGTRHAGLRSPWLSHLQHYYHTTGDEQGNQGR